MQKERLGSWRGLERKNVGMSCSKLSERKPSPVTSAELRDWGFSSFIASELLKSSLESTTTSAFPSLLLHQYKWDFPLASVASDSS